MEWSADGCAEARWLPAELEGGRDVKSKEPEERDKKKAMKGPVSAQELNPDPPAVDVVSEGKGEEVEQEVSTKQNSQIAFKES